MQSRPAECTCVPIIRQKLQLMRRLRGPYVVVSCESRTQAKSFELVIFKLMVKSIINCKSPVYDEGFAKIVTKSTKILISKM